MNQILSILTLLCCGTALAAESSHDYPITPVPFTAVHVADSFWAPRIETNRLYTIPFAFQQCEKSGRMDNFERAAKALRHETFANHAPPGFPFDDTDVYKVLEGASYVLAVQPDPKLQKYLDDLIAKIAAAQEPDGYLYTARTIDPEHPHEWSGHERWLRDPDESHELYDSGHLFEAAVAHYQATGETNLLNVAIKNANLLCQVFGPATNQLNHIWPGHEIVEMGLAKLYRATGDERYLRLAKFFLDVRGPGGDEYHQSHIKPVQQREAVGHAVRATYLYSGMADVAAMTGDSSYTTAIDAIWNNAVGKKLYITGGIGAVPAGEAFGADYYLPNKTAYCETCASVGNDFWNYRLFLLHGQARFMDVFERTLYNALLDGVSLDGERFFYPNPLASFGQDSRSPWFGCACCPGNITRFLPSLPGFFYAHKGEELYVNLYASGTADVQLADGLKVKISQETRYPWDGHIKIVLSPESSGTGQSSRFTLKLRIPGWARNEVVPDGLYRFADENSESPVLKLPDGSRLPVDPKLGYASISREWRKGDSVELDLPMPIRRILADEKVQADRGRVALQRGPIVYCLEGIDNHGHVANLMLPNDAPLRASFKPNLLNGVEIIQGDAEAFLRATNGAVFHKSQEFTAIPYYAWANRRRSEMTVWIANREEAVQPPPQPTIASTSKVSLSHNGSNPEAINDQRVPGSSPNAFFTGDEASVFHWWPRKGTQEWLQYDFAAPARVSGVEVYWFDDTGRGECRVPESWHLLYREHGDWKPVPNPTAYTCSPGQSNRTQFDPIETDGLRLELQLRKDFSAGLYEWKVE